MRMLLTLLAVLGVMGLAFWAYRENYRTQAALDTMRAVQNEIAGLRERLGTLNAEWAYLNRPERLARLVALNADRLKLAPLTPGQMLSPGQIAYPMPRPVAEAGVDLYDPTLPRPPGFPPPKPRHFVPEATP